MPYTPEQINRQLDMIHSNTVLANVIPLNSIINLNNYFTIQQGFLVHRTREVIDPQTNTKRLLTFSDHRGLFFEFVLGYKKYSIYYHSLNSCMGYNGGAQKLTANASKADEIFLDTSQPLRWNQHQNEIGLCLVENIKNLYYPDFVVLGECFPEEQYGLDIINVIREKFKFIYGTGNLTSCIEQYSTSGITCMHKKIPNTAVPSISYDTIQVNSTSLGKPLIIKLDGGNCWIFFLHWHNKYARAPEQRVVVQAKTFFDNAFAQWHAVVPQIIIIMGDTNMFYATTLPDSFPIKINNHNYNYTVYPFYRHFMTTSGATGEVLDRIYILYNPSQI